MFNLISGDKTNEQYLELYNRAAVPVNVGDWRIDGINNFDIPSGTTIPANGFLVIARKSDSLISLYPGVLSTNNTVGNFNPAELSSAGERIVLSRPRPNGTNEPNYVVVDEVTYGSGGRWGQWADGGGSSLELIDVRSDHRLAANWADSDTPTNTNWTTVSNICLVQLGEGTTNFNVLEISLAGGGECLIDEVKVTPAGGTNRLVNGGFESGTNGWVFEGDYDQSALQTTGALAGANCLLIRAGGRGDYAANRITASWTAGLTNGQSATLSASVKWLRGNPEVLLRLRGNYLEATGHLAVPNNLGTPGAQSTRAATNLGPALFEISHSPVLPSANQMVLITARAHDADGVTNVVLRYRIDPSSTLTSASMNDAGTNGDAVAGDGLYSARIPGQVSGTLAAFRVEASDAFGAATRFPAEQVMYPGDTERRECLIRFGEGSAPGSFGTYRLWMTAATFNAWTNRSRVHNGSLDVTFVYGRQRAIYNAGAKFSGSVFSSKAFDTPTGASCGYALIFPEDDSFLGETDSSLDASSGDGSGQVEQLFHWMANGLGLPSLYRRYVHLYVNGVLRDPSYLNQVYTVCSDTQQPGSDYLKQWYPDDTDGDLYKVERWYQAYAFPLPDGVVPAEATLSLNFRTNASSTNLDVPHYRWTWLKRAVPQEGLASDYTSVSNLVVAFTNGAASAAYVAAVEAQMDAEQWMRVIALGRIACARDNYGTGNGHNVYAYKPTAASWRLQTTDLDLSFTTTGCRPETNLVTGWPCDTNIVNMINTPAFGRHFWRAVRDAANGPMLPANLNPVLDANYTALVSNGATANSPDSSFTIGSSIYTIRTWYSNRWSSLTNQLAAVSPSFAITNNSGNNFTTTATAVLLGGTAPVEIASLRISGRTTNEVVTWGTVTNWNYVYNLTVGTNAITNLGLDRLSVSIATNSITIIRQ